MCGFLSFCDYEMCKPSKLVTYNTFDITYNIHFRFAILILFYFKDIGLLRAYLCVKNTFRLVFNAYT